MRLTVTKPREVVTIEKRRASRPETVPSLRRSGGLWKVTYTDGGWDVVFGNQIAVSE